MKPWSYSHVQCKDSLSHLVRFTVITAVIKRRTDVTSGCVLFQHMPSLLRRANDPAAHHFPTPRPSQWLHGFQRMGRVMEQGHVPRYRVPRTSHPPIMPRHDPSWRGAQRSVPHDWFCATPRSQGCGVEGVYVRVVVSCRFQAGG